MSGQNWFPTLNDALAAEGLVDLWPLGVNVQYGQTVSLASGGRWISVYRDTEGWYERPVHYATLIPDTHTGGQERGVDTGNESVHDNGVGDSQ